MPESINNFITSSGTGGDAPSALSVVFAAMIENLEATQKFVSDGVTPLGVSILKIQDEAASFYTDYMNDTLSPAITNAAAEGDANQRSADVQKFTAQLSVVNSQLSQSNSFWGGLSQTVQQTGSDVSSTQQLIYQMLSQGVLQIYTTIVQVL